MNRRSSRYSASSQPLSGLLSAKLEGGCRATSETGPACPPTSAPRQPTVPVDCADRQSTSLRTTTGFVWRFATNIFARRPQAPRISLGGGRGAIAAGWWSWHPGLISRDASQVQWRSTADRRSVKDPVGAPICPACNAAPAAGHHGCRMHAYPGTNLVACSSRHKTANGIS